MVSAYLGEKDQVFEQLEKAYEEHQAGLRSDTWLKKFLKSHIGHMTTKVSDYMP